MAYFMLTGKIILDLVEEKSYIECDNIITDGKYRQRGWEVKR